LAAGLSPRARICAISRASSVGVRAAKRGGERATPVRPLRTTAPARGDRYVHLSLDLRSRSLAPAQHPCVRRRRLVVRRPEHPEREARLGLEPLRRRTGDASDQPEPSQIRPEWPSHRDADLGAGPLIARNAQHVGARGRRVRAGPARRQGMISRQAAKRGRGAAHASASRGRVSFSPPRTVTCGVSSLLRAIREGGTARSRPRVSRSATSRRSPQRELGRDVGSRRSCIRDEIRGRPSAWCARLIWLGAPERTI
jgi:hypothetical protein